MEEEMSRLLIQNQNLIYSIMEKYFKNYSNKEDLFQVGAIGFIKAYAKFDGEQGAKFTTYAYSYIWGEMKKFVREDKGFKVSRDIHKMAILVEKTSQYLRQQLMQEPTIGQIANYIGIEETYVVRAIKSSYAMQSMEQPVCSEGKEMVLADFISDDSTSNIDDILMLREEFAALSPFEQELLQKRYFSDMTQAETAEALGISQVQVSRKEKKILEKIKTGWAA
ncbi:MAG: sigma-70 family RNA polymerase sigma factor [Bacilli bacterium]|nr:sigma-70 family RNA polymerase sigma factor [Bacilli bacterium]